MHTLVCCTNFKDMLLLRERHEVATMAGRKLIWSSADVFSRLSWISYPLLWILCDYTLYIHYVEIVSCGSQVLYQMASRELCPWASLALEIWLSETDAYLHVTRRSHCLCLWTAASCSISDLSWFSENQHCEERPHWRWKGGWRSYGSYWISSR